MAMRIFCRHRSSSSSFLWVALPSFVSSSVYTAGYAPALRLGSTLSKRGIHYGCHSKLFSDQCSSSLAAPLSLLQSMHKARAMSPFTLPPLRAQRQSTTTRLFGSNPATSNEPGEINLSDERDDMTTIPVDMAALHRTVDAIRDILAYTTYDINLQLIDEDFMKEVNKETRGVDASTDVLSFSVNECVEPGVLKDVPSHGAHIDDMYCLGDLLICVDYVARRCEEDRNDENNSGIGHDNGVIEGEVVAEDSSSINDNDGDPTDDDAEYEYQDIEVELDEWDDRGIAPALLKTYNPEVRIHMLVIHGMLHLIGYDHIEDDDYELMVVKEDEVMAELKRRLGDDFGVVQRALPGSAF